VVKQIVMSCTEYINDKYTAYSLAYPYEYNDGGKSTSKRSKQNYDCTVRALAIYKNIPYDEAYDILKNEGRKSGSGFMLSEWLVKNGFIRKTFPAIKGQKRMNPATFCKEYKTGKYICKTAKHVFAVINGVLHDEWEQRPDRCIYAMFFEGEK
jgi:hypothetical protein